MHSESSDLIENKEMDEIDDQYELMAYSSVKIDYEYIISLIQCIVLDEDETDEERQKRIDEIREYIEKLQKDNAQLGRLMMQILEGVIQDKKRYQGKSIAKVLEDMRIKAIHMVVNNFVKKWFVEPDAVMYAAFHSSNGKIKDRSILKDKGDYKKYKLETKNSITKYKYNTMMCNELEKVIQEEILPLLSR